MVTVVILIVAVMIALGSPPLALPRERADFHPRLARALPANLMYFSYTT